MENTDTTLLTVDEVADKLSLTNKTIRKHIRSGKIPAQKRGKTLVHFVERLLQNLSRIYDDLGK